MAEPTRGSSFFTSAAGLVFCAFAVIALFFLVAEHRAHLGYLLPYVPLALLGLCVVLHAYLHGHLHQPRDGEPSDRATHHSSHGKSGSA